jgi:hypothetical protein
MNTNDWIKYITEKINNINCSPIQQYMIILTFEPDDNLKQIIKEHNCTYRVIPKEFVPEGEESNCFIMSNKPTQKKCPYLNQTDNKLRTTFFPDCTCWGQFCDNFEGYCPIRDKERGDSK